MQIPQLFTRVLWIVPALLLAADLRPAAAQQGRVLGRDEIRLYGIGLTVEPAQQTVPKDIATIVSTFLQTPSLPETLPPFPRDAEVRGTLRGPSFPNAIELTARPNTPFTIPPLTVPGRHTLEDIRLVAGDEVLLRGTPEHVSIDVIERLLVTQVTARALTAEEIREMGIAFDASHFQAYNFSAAFAIANQPIELSFPVVLPRLPGPGDVTEGQVGLPAIPPPVMPNLQTIIPDTLKLQAMIPNLSVVGFTLRAPDLQGQNLVVPPIPGVVVIPGDIGFLNQYFSVMLLVGNVAPEGSGLVVSDLTAEIVLPPGKDGSVGSGDDPLRMAQTARGPSPSTQLVAQPGPDGRLGTADDIVQLAPGDSGNAEYLVEGVREGSHVVEMRMTGTLNGLPGGPVTINGAAAGSVLVRNPNFTLTFTHPEVVTAGEAYTLDVTVTNTSQAPANFVTLTLYPRNVSGATIVGESVRGIESIPPGDAATLSFDLVSRVTGNVTAATLDGDGEVAGRFELKTAVGELGIPLSPDSLVLPKEARPLPAALREAALGLLGRAHAVATAPAAALPPDVIRFSRKIVIDRAIEVAEAGLRISLKEPVADSAAQLLMDFAGSNVTRLPSLVDPAALPFEQANYAGFDDLRRRSVRGDAFARAVGAILLPGLTSGDAAAFHRALAGKWSYRPAHVSVLLAAGGGPLPVRLVLVDPEGRRIGAPGEGGKILKEQPYSEYVPFIGEEGATVGALAVLAAPAAGSYTVRIEPVAGATPGPFTISIVAPDAGGALTQATYNSLTADRAPPALAPPDHPHQFTFAGFEAGGGPVPSMTGIPDSAPSIVGVVQQLNADLIGCDPAQSGVPGGRVIAVLFSEEVTPASVHDRLPAAAIEHFSVDGNQVVGVALQPGRRIAFLALRDSIGPFVPRSLTAAGVEDPDGRPMPPATVPIEIAVSGDAGVVSGRVLRADGTPVAHAELRLFYWLPCEPEPRFAGISAKHADGDGRYSWEYVLRAFRSRIVAIDPETEESRELQFNVQRSGQQLNVDIVFLGRGTFSGRTLAEDGRPLAGAAIRVTSLTDHSQYGATSDALGRFTIARVPVGNLFVEAVHTAARAQVSLSDFIGAAGQVVSRDLTLLTVEQQEVVIKYGAVRGHVLREDGTTPAGDLPVYAYYKHLSQPGVRCPGNPALPECAIAVTRADRAGRYAFDRIVAGHLRIVAFDQAALSQGDISVVLAEAGQLQANLLLSGGLGTVSGIVLDAGGTPVPGARVGGGLSLTTTGADGRFALTDVPVGRREIVAVSDELGASGSAAVDIVRAGQTVAATIVLSGAGSVSGSVTASDGATPMASTRVHLFERSGANIRVVGSATTDAAGAFQIAKVPVGTYWLSAFDAGFTDGNIVPVALKFHQQNVRASIRFRGGNGRVNGVVLDADGETPLQAKVGISGDRVLVAGGLVGVAFQRVANFKIVDTDADGRFSASGLLVGPFTASAAGQFSPDPISVESSIPSPGASVDVTLTLQATSQIRGTVFTPDGVQPAGKDLIVRYKSEAFRIICTASSSGDPSCQSIPQGIQEETVVTDDQGRFWLPVVNAGAFTITVEDPATGRVARAQGHVAPGQTASMAVRLLARADVVVQVLGADGVTPIPNARVEVEQPAYPRASRQAQADAGGTALFTGGDQFSEGELTILATDLRNGFAGRASAVVRASGAQVVAKVYLYDAAGTVTGRVYAADGITPVPNAEVVVSSGSNPIAFAVTGADGRYEVGTVPLGPVSIDTFEARTGRRGATSGQVDFNGQEAVLNVVQAALGMVTGHLYASGTLQPLKGWRVALSPRSPTGIALPPLSTTSGVDGAFSFPGTSLGSFTLSASHPDVVGFGRANGVIEREGMIVDVPMIVNVVRRASGAIAGIVRTASGAPAASAAIEICHREACGDTAVHLTAAPDGAFLLEDVPLGLFSVIARSQTSDDAGSAVGELAFAGDVATVTVVLAGLTEVRGQVVDAQGQPVPNAPVVLQAQPSTGCGLQCAQASDGAGRFSFANVPARTFTVTASHPTLPLKGSTGGALTPGEQTEITVVLEPAVTMTGRVRRANGDAAPGVIAELILQAGSERRLYQQTAADGTFAFDAVPLLPYTLVISDPIGPGVASRQGTLTGPVAFGDIVLDEAAPQVASMEPAPSATKVARETDVRIEFSEPILPGTIAADSVSLLDPSGAAVAATLDVTDNDTVVTLDPLADLAAETKFTVRIRGVKDRHQKPMAADYLASFTTLDVTSPSLADASPAANANGVPIYSPIRLKFSEPIDAAHLGPSPIALTGPGGAVAGRTDYLFGHSVVVFTPNLPLDENAQYRVVMAPARDLSGNQQAAGTDYVFRTSDRTPPQVLSLELSNNGVVVENGIASAKADVGSTHDVLFVDFFLNGVLAHTDRTHPFEMSFRARAELAPPGGAIQVAAVPTDTSGNRGGPTIGEMSVIADQPPAVSLALAVPGGGSAAKNGDRIVATVSGTDDLGLAQLGYHAATGHPADAATRQLDPPAPAHSETFAFHVPLNAAPGSTIRVEASAVDTKGQIRDAVPVDLQVVDAVPPVVAITGATSGARVQPGQSSTVVVTAEDLGGVVSITFAAGGVAAATETRTVDPAQNSVVTSFTVTVPATAKPGETLTLDASAVDRAGNAANAGRVVLPVADTAAPIVAVQTANGATTAVIGRPVQVVVHAEDELNLAQITLSGSGAFTYQDTKQVSPPSGSHSATFDVPVPADAAPGSTLTLRATAVDTSGNTSVPASLVLTLVTGVEVILPPSRIVAAGESATVEVSLAAPAGPGGIRVDFLADDTGVAAATPSVVFAEGQSDGEIAITGVAGGTTVVRALVNAVPRASMTVTVRGGIVSGTVFDSLLNPVAGAQVTVAGGGLSLVTESGADGSYAVEGIPGPAVAVKALDPQTRLFGYTSATMGRPGGFASANVVLIPAGSIAGAVRLPDGVTPAGPGVRVDISDRAVPGSILATTFTDADSRYAFPLVTLGDYAIVASSTAGGRGRTAISVTQSGQEVERDIFFLGSGRVTGAVRAGTALVPNAQLTLRTWDVFGLGPVVTAQTLDGTFVFENVPVGQFSIEARDPVTQQAGGFAGTISQDGQTVQADVALESYAILRGTVYRADGTTPVVGADVLVHGRLAVTDDLGQYRFDVLPLGPFTLSVRDRGTRGQAIAAGTLPTHLEERTLDVTLAPQGRLRVTVVNASGQPVPSASVRVQVTNGPNADEMSGTTGQDGVVLLERLLAGSFSASAAFGTLSGTTAGTIEAGAITEASIALQATASIAGTVYEPDGQTPASGGWVHLDPWTSTPIAPDGTYRFSGLALGWYQPSVRDSAHALRAVTPWEDRVALTANAQVVTRDFVMVGLGSVTGQVFYNDGLGPAPNIRVVVRGLHPQIGSVAHARTNAAGFYSVTGVAVGAYKVSAEDPDRRLLGEAFGTLAQHGGTATSDIVLASNAIALPVSRHDGNRYVFDLQPDGSTRAGSLAFGAGNGASPGASLLTIRSGGVDETFAGSTTGTMEDAEREIVTRQNGLHGLNVARKLFVPFDGYFGRQLELLTNPGPSPIVVDVLVTHHLRPGIGEAAQVLSTSSGDAAFEAVSPDTADRWIVFRALGHTGTPGSGVPSRAFVLGDTAGTPIDAAQIDGVDPTAVTFGWSGVTIEPGQTVALLHFIAQQTSDQAAQAAAERLMQVPPEALAGLSPDELAWVRNFALPEDGVSAVAPLPGLAGSIAGTVFDGDSSTPTPFADVQFTSSSVLYKRVLRVKADADGRYVFATDAGSDSLKQLIPQVPFTVVATYPGTAVLSPDASGAFEPGASAATADIVFSNTGTLIGVLRHAAGAVVTSGSVAISGMADPRPIGGDGRFRAGGLAPGSYLVTGSASNPQGTPVSVTAAIEIVAGETTAIELMLPEAWSVSGKVTTASGGPAAGIQVALRHGAFSQVTTSDTGGQYAFSEVPDGAYVVSATEPRTQIRSEAPVVVNGAPAVQDLALVAVGSVKGLVTDPSGQPVPAQAVSLRFTREGVHVTQWGTTDGSGRYRFENVPASTVTVTAQHASNPWYGEAAGAITTEGQELVADIVLRDNAVDLPVTLHDANNFPFDLQQNGAFSSGYEVFGGAGYGASELAIVSGGTVIAFPARLSGAREDDGGEVAIQATIAGLQVTRKTLVPQRGYFARQLELLENPTAEPITVDVRILSHAGRLQPPCPWCPAVWNAPMVLETSSGDTVLDVSDPATADRWLVLDDEADGDPFEGGGGMPALAVAFDGAGAAERVGAATLAEPGPRALEYTWRNVTIPPGGSVAYLHFTVQQTSRAGAIAAAGRLAQLPPEALEGLSPSERQAIRNFVVPTDGGQVPPLPTVDGTVTGRVLASGGSPAIPNAAVRFKSAHPLFGRTWAVTADASGAFTLAASFESAGQSIAIPASEYTLVAAHPVTGYTSPAVTGTFADGSPASVRDVPLAGSANVTGVLRRGNGVPVPDHDVYDETGASVRTGGDGAFTMTGYQPGARTFSSSLEATPPQIGSALQAILEVTLAADETVSADLVFPPAGAVQGTVRTATGSGAENVWMVIGNGIWSRSMDATPGGGYAFTDVPAGQYELAAHDRPTGLVVRETVAIAADQTLLHDFTLPAKGQLAVTVTFPGGAPAAQSPVYVKHAGSSSFTSAGTTGADGRATIANVPAGAFTVRAYRPGSFTFYTDANGTLASDGDVVPLAITLPGIGKVTGTLTHANGTAYAGRWVQLRRAGTNDYVTDVTTDGTGRFTFTAVALNQPLHLAVLHPTVFGLWRYGTDFTLTADGETHVENIAIPAAATLRVRIVDADGLPMAGLRIRMKDAVNVNFMDRGLTDADGSVTVPQVPEGNFMVRALEGANMVILGEWTGAIAPADDGQTVLLTGTVTRRSGTVRGRVFGSDGQTPLPGAQVAFQSADGQATLATMTTGPAGEYEFTDVQTGNLGFRVRATTPFDLAASAQANGSFSTTGEVVTIDLSLPLNVITVRGTVTTPAGKPLPDVTVSVRGSRPEAVPDYTQTSAAGEYAFPSFPVAGSDLTVTASAGGLRTSSTAPVPGNGQLLTVDLTLDVVRGTITVHVLAADGTTGVPSASVEIAAAGGAQAHARTADDEGLAVFDNAYVPAGGFTAKAVFYGWPTYQEASAEGTLGDGGTTLVQLSLPMSVLTGVVTRADGQPLASPSVIAMGSDMGTRYAAKSTAAGEYLIFGLPVGAFTVTAQDFSTGLRRSVDGAVDDIGVRVVQDIALPATGAVTGRVLDAAGNPVPSALVQILTSLGEQRQAWGDATGTYRFDGVPAGEVAAFARFWAGSQTVYSSASGTVAADGELVLDLTPAPAGTVAGRVLAADGVTPVADTSVLVESFGAAGLAGHFQKPLVSDASGAFAAADVPAGLLRIVATPLEGSPGIAEAVLAAGATMTADVRLGTAVPLDHTLAGDDQFQYTVSWDGALYGGGLAGTPAGQTPFAGTSYISANGGDFCCINEARRELNGRQIALGPVSSRLFTITRKVYVPESGGFARYLEIIQNPTGSDLPLTYFVGEDPDFCCTMRVLADPALNGWRYAVLDNGGTAAPTKPAVGFVFGGSGAPSLRVSALRLSRDGGSQFAYHWKTTVPAGGTVIFMRFVIQRPAGAGVEAEAQAAALADLTDPHALAGMSDAEKSAVKNFIIPPAMGGQDDPEEQP